MIKSRKNPSMLKDQSRKNPSMQKDQRLLNSGITSSLKETLKDVLRMTMGLKLVTALRSKSHRIICTPRENLKDLNIPNSKRLRDPKHSSLMTTSNQKASLKDQSRKNQNKVKGQRLTNFGITLSPKENSKDVRRMTMDLKLVTERLLRSRRIICIRRENSKDLNILNSKRLIDQKLLNLMITSNPRVSLKDPSRRNPNKVKDQRLSNSGTTSNPKENLKVARKMTLDLRSVIEPL
uniref:Uncharacterized protein n=1 Tax=Cacopsylla melanoneura TaxID=428564 RepID=A0A8D8TYJ9_9HEMI